MKKLKNNIIDIYDDNKMFFLYVFLSLIMGLFLRILTVGGFFRIVPFITDLLFIILLGSFGFLFKEKYRNIYFLFWLIFFSILCFINHLYYIFYQSFVSVNLLSTASMVGEVNDSLFARMKLVQFIYFLFPLIFLFIYKKFKFNGDNLLKDKKIFRVLILPCVFIVIICISIYSIKDARKFSNQYNREYIVKKYGLYLYTFNDLFQSFEFNDNIDYDNFALNYRNYYSCKWDDKEKDNEFSDIFKDKNVLFIHAESIQNFLIDLKIDGKYITPNINKFAREGIYFSKFYPQISVGTSSDTEFTLQTGLLPSSNGTVFVNYYDREYKSMAQYFKDNDYYTFSMHGNDREYWNREVMHEILGYDDFYAQDAYMIPSIDSQEYVGLGIGDKEFFKQSIPMIREINNTKNKYFGTLITLSNHSPYNDLEKYGEFNIDLEFLENTTMENYIRSSHYADSAFGDFMKMIKNSGLDENLVIVFYGDHESRISKKEFDLLYNYDASSDDILDKNNPSYVDVNQYYYELLRNTPLIIWSSDEKFNMEISEVMGMYDVLPTIANMFGFDEKYSLGHDIFDDKENIVVFPNGNVLTDKVYYSEVNDEYITFTNDAIDSDYISKIKDYANQLLEVSNGIIKYDLIDKIGKDVGKCEKK